MNTAVRAQRPALARVRQAPVHPRQRGLTPFRCVAPRIAEPRAYLPLDLIMIPQQGNPHALPYGRLPNAPSSAGSIVEPCGGGSCSMSVGLTYSDGQPYDPSQYYGP
jgi:hypothetical protein